MTGSSVYSIGKANLQRSPRRPQIKKRKIMKNWKIHRNSYFDKSDFTRPPKDSRGWKQEVNMYTKYTQKCDHGYSLLQAYPGWCKEPTTSTEWPPASFSHFGLEGLHGTWPVLQSCHGHVWSAMWQVFLLLLRWSYAAMCLCNLCILGVCPTQIEISPESSFSLGTCSKISNVLRWDDMRTSFLCHCSSNSEWVMRPSEVSWGQDGESVIMFLL